MVRNGMGDELRMSILKMIEKIEKWNEELELMMAEKRESNPIVGRVLEHAACLMGLMVPSTNMTDTLATVDFGLEIPTVRMSDCCLQGIEPCEWKGKRYQWVGNRVFRLGSIKELRKE